MHAPLLSHESCVHGLPSSQLTPFTLPAQLPLASQVSEIVHAFLSSHAAVLKLKVQPLLASQNSSVHTLLSLQSADLPGAQLPLSQWSPEVQTLPSSQSAEFAAKTQPLLLSQLSSVHGLLSLHATWPPAPHLPSLHASPAVQALPSSQAVTLFRCAHPVLEHESSVHALPSSQVTSSAKATQKPLLHAEPEFQPALSQKACLQVMPSLPALATQPLMGSQLSTVQGLPSSHSVWLTPLHSPPAQLSPPVQALPSSQLPELASWLQPPCGPPKGSQLSLVQTFPSSQLTAPPPAHLPPAHASLTVQALPSVHGVELFAWTQPFLASQASSVQALPSSQPVTLPLRQTPPLQLSPLVHALPSSQVLPTPAGLNAHLPSTHASSVQVFWSLQSLSVLHAQLGAPLHLPLAQMSPEVQAFPSSQLAALGELTQPKPGKHASSVQGLLSVQLRLAPPLHAPAKQLSPLVQSLPSVQVMPSAAATKAHSPPTHESCVHTSLSSHWPSLVHGQLGVPPQLPALQLSAVVQSLPSLQLAVLGKCTQSPLFLSQLSSVQVLLSSQVLVTPPGRHLPPPHTSPLVHALPSVHAALLFA